MIWVIAVLLLLVAAEGAVIMSDKLPWKKRGEKK